MLRFLVPSLLALATMLSSGRSSFARPPIEAPRPSAWAVDDGPSELAARLETRLAAAAEGERIRRTAGVGFPCVWALDPIPVIRSLDRVTAEQAGSAADAAARNALESLGVGPPPVEGRRSFRREPSLQSVRR